MTEYLNSKNYQSDEAIERKKWLEMQIFEQKYRQFDNEMISAIKHFFPIEAEHFKKPSLERQYTKFFEIADSAPTDGRYSDLHMNALLGESFVRYIDDFIDTILWPRISGYKKEALKKTFERFCQEFLFLLKKYVPTYPSEITELWSIELDLELDPSQGNFNSKIIKLFQ